MKTTKIKSFTLAELLIVMVITAIVIGMAFSVLRLVQNQITAIQKNYEKSSNLALFEQKLWQDFYELHILKFNTETNSLIMQSEIDTVIYSFQEDYTLRNNDTLKIKLDITKVFFDGKEVKNGSIDAMSISGEKELHEYAIFVSKTNDITLKMNQEDGF